MSEVGPSAWEDDTFDIRFAFFSSTDMEIRLRVLEGRRSRLQERLARVQAELERTQAEVNRYAAELQRHGVESVEREVRWLSDLIQAERGGPSNRMTDHEKSRTDKENPMGSVRVGIVGVGNCATSLIQGVEYYKDADPSGTVPGLMHVKFGDYHVSDVSSSPRSTSTTRRSARTSRRRSTPRRTTRSRSPTCPPWASTSSAARRWTVSASTTARPSRSPAAEPVDVVQALKDAEVDVLVSYLPVGSEEADKFYAQCAIDAGVGFVNALPVFIASDPVWAKKFEDAGVPIVGDDIKSQVGATITHRVMAKLFEDRGVALDRTYQLNVGGNMDFKNMLERERLESKKVSKTQAVTSNLKGELADKVSDRNVHIGPSDYVAWLDDRKWAYVRLEGRAFGDVPLNLEYKLEVWDSPNSAGIIIDAVRAAKIAMDRGIGGPILPASAYLMKSPPVQMPDDTGRAELEKFIRGRVIHTVVLRLAGRCTTSASGPAGPRPDLRGRCRSAGGRRCRDEDAGRRPRRGPRRAGRRPAAPSASPPSSSSVRVRARTPGSSAPACPARSAHPRPHRVLVLDGPLVDRGAGCRLGGGVDERAAPVALTPARRSPGRRTCRRSWASADPPAAPPLSAAGHSR